MALLVNPCRRRNPWKLWMLLCNSTRWAICMIHCLLWIQCPGSTSHRIVLPVNLCRRRHPWKLWTLLCSITRWAIYVTCCLPWTRCPGLMSATKCQVNLFARHLPRKLWIPLCSFHRWTNCAGRCPLWTRCPSLTMTLFESLSLRVCILTIFSRCSDPNLSPQILVGIRHEASIITENLFAHHLP